jgi:hypothetical protein
VLAIHLDAMHDLDKFVMTTTSDVNNITNILIIYNIIP